MTQEEILEGNKLIAIFDGYVIDNTYPDTDRTYNKNGNIELHTTVKHHSDWEWLMPIVDKISKLHSIPELYANYSKVIDALMMLDINILFKAVVEFIKWYNQNK